MAEPLTRTGMRICGARGHKDVRRALIRYARWLRANFEFPIRVPVYLYPHSFLVTGDGRECSASFFEPYDRRVEPYIRIATGDYSQLKRELGRDSALATYIVSLSHEVMHYQQWIAGRIVSERGVAAQAVRMLRAYELTVDRP